MADPDPAGRAALDALDRILAERPGKGSDQFAVALEHLCAMRDGLIARGERGDRLGAVNSLISATLGAQFPLGKVPWPLLEATRAALARLLSERLGTE